MAMAARDQRIALLELELQERIARLELESKGRIARLELELKLREEQLRLARLEKYGPKGEQLSQDQVLLLDLEPGVQAEEVAKEAPCQESQEILDLIAKLYAVESERLALGLKIIQTGR